MIAKQLTRHCAAASRVVAPVDQVWSDIGTLTRVLQHSTGIRQVEPAADGNTATFAATVIWGPMRWAVPGKAILRSVDSGRRLEWVGLAPRIALQVAFTLQLDPITSDETTVHYEAALSAPRKGALQLGLWNVICTELDGYVRYFVRDVGMLSEQHSRARKQLGGG